MQDELESIPFVNRFRYKLVFPAVHRPRLTVSEPFNSTMFCDRQIGIWNLGKTAIDVKRAGGRFRINT